MARRLSRFHAGWLAVTLMTAPALAQSIGSTPDAQPNNYPPALPARVGKPPAVVFEKLAEITLPGPLADGQSFIAGDYVMVPVEGGIARVKPEPGATATTAADTKAAPVNEWVLSSDGKRRYRCTAEGLVEAEKSRHKGRTWHRRWHIVAPNSILAPPVIIGPRLCYAGLDDRVTCVKAANGHRLWSVDLGDRLSRALACWPGCSDSAGDASLVLAVPDDGASVVALDVYNGARIASYDLPDQHRFASSAMLVAPDTVAIARKGYEAADAALLLLRIAPAPSQEAAPAPSPAPSAPVPYNPGSPTQAGSFGR